MSSPLTESVTTLCLEPEERNKAWTLLASQLRQGRQAYVVVPLVAQSEASSLKDVKTACQELKKTFGQARVDLLHGRMEAAAKEKVMREFSTGQVDILVATTVVEVGMDMPNACFMLNKLLRP